VQTSRMMKRTGMTVATGMSMLLGTSLPNGQVAAHALASTGSGSTTHHTAQRVRPKTTSAIDAHVEAMMVQRLTHQAARPVYTFYTVRSGDTVASIAERFHDVAWLIRRRNGGLWAMVPGQQIRVWQWPFGTPYYAIRTVTTDKPQFYVVRSGDTVGGIAGKLNTTVSILADENGLGDASLIYAGQTLVLHHYTAHQRRTLVPGVPASRLHAGLLLTDVANLVGTDAALVRGLSWHESQWQSVRGSSGEIGMMQIMPYMADWVQRTLIGYKLDPKVPVNGVLEGTLLLQYYLDMTHGDVHRSLALYHSGNVRANPRNGVYIRACLALRDYFYHHPRVGW